MKTPRIDRTRPGGIGSSWSGRRLLRRKLLALALGEHLLAGGAVVDPGEPVEDARRVLVVHQLVESVLHAVGDGEVADVGPDYTLADICNFAIANGMQNGFSELVNDKDTPRILDWLARINERPACKEMFAKSKREELPAQKPATAPA